MLYIGYQTSQIFKWKWGRCQTKRIIQGTGLHSHVFVLETRAHPFHGPPHCRCAAPEKSLRGDLVRVWSKGSNRKAGFRGLSAPTPCSEGRAGMARSGETPFEVGREQELCHLTKSSAYQRLLLTSLTHKWHMLSTSINLFTNHFFLRNQMFLQNSRHFFFSGSEMHIFLSNEKICDSLIESLSWGCECVSVLSENAFILWCHHDSFYGKQLKSVLGIYRLEEMRTALQA